MGLKSSKSWKKHVFYPRATAKTIGSYVIIFDDITLEAYSMYLEKKTEFSRKTFFRWKYFAEKLISKKILDFVIKILMKMPKSQILLRFFPKKKIIEKKTRFFFLQYHTISVYATRYEILTPRSLGGSSRIKKTHYFVWFAWFSSPPKIQQRCTRVV